MVKGRNRDTAWYSIIDSEWPSVSDRLTAWLDPDNFDELARQRTSMARAPEGHAAPVHAGPGQRVSSGSPFEPTIGFSRAVRSGSRVLVSGTGPVWPDGSCPDDAETQTRRCLEIIGQALAEAGAGWGDVVRTRMFLTDSRAVDQVGAVHGELLGDVRPAATMAIVAGLADPRWKVEIEAEAECAP